MDCGLSDEGEVILDCGLNDAGDVVLACGDDEVSQDRSDMTKVTPSRAGQYVGDKMSDDQAQSSNMAEVIPGWDDQDDDSEKINDE